MVTICIFFPSTSQLHKVKMLLTWCESGKVSLQRKHNGILSANITPVNAQFSAF